MVQPLFLVNKLNAPILRTRRWQQQPSRVSSGAPQDKIHLQMLLRPWEIGQRRGNAFLLSTNLAMSLTIALHLAPGFQRCARSLYKGTLREIRHPLELESLAHQSATYRLTSHWTLYLLLLQLESIARPLLLPRLRLESQLTRPPHLHLYLRRLHQKRRLHQSQHSRQLQGLRSRLHHRL